MGKERTLLLVGVDPQVASVLGRVLSTDFSCKLLALGERDKHTFLLKNIAPDESVGVVLVDCKALHPAGHTLFHEIKSRFPKAIHVLLVDQDNRDCILSAANEGGSYKVLLKPWGQAKLTLTIEEAFYEYELVYENRRLTQELEQANQELKALNADLEIKVKEKVEQLIQAVNYDALTGVPSRNLIHERLEHVIRYAKQTQQTVVVLYLGLDNFKLINESLGYRAGDHLLKQVTERLTTHLRSCDSIARMGGDEFCLIINNTDIKEEPGIIAKRILDIITPPFEISRREIFLTASIGISVFPYDAAFAASLFANAESAMRQVKMKSKNGYQYYSGSLSKFAKNRLSLESQLRKAADRSEFELYYQPRVNTELGMIVGVEALLRWQNPRRGLLAPAEFLPVLEDTGLIEPVGDWVIERACRALSEWMEAGVSGINIAVNLSARQFRKKMLVPYVRDILEAAGLQGSSAGLEFEITESLLMENIGKTKQLLNEFSAMGIKLAVDDFGTGYSSLSYLTQFPLNYLKIDKSFVTDIASIDSTKAVVEAIISLASSLKLGVIAEGIETLEQLHALQALACKEFQGFLFSEPLTAEEVLRLLKADRRLSLATLSNVEHATSTQSSKLKH